MIGSSVLIKVPELKVSWCHYKALLSAPSIRKESVPPFFNLIPGTDSRHRL